MKTQKVRHQLFLTKELSARLDRIATGTARARSELLVEALEAWLNRRNPAAAEEALGARLSRFERHIEAVRRQQGLQWEVLAREGNDPVWIRQGKTMAATFHPELSDDKRVHQYFIDMVRNGKEL